MTDITAAPQPPSHADILAAARRLEGHVRVTPLLCAPALDQAAGRRVLVKAECLQHTGSFKYRGAKSAVTALVRDRPDVHGVIAYSSGNHAQGVARAAVEAGLPAAIVMPSDAPRAKIDGARALGGEVVLYDRFGEDREAIGGAIALQRDLHLIRPYDDANVIAGQAGVGLEIARQAALNGITKADILVCCGGGGLTCGIALACAVVAPGLRVRTVEPVGFDDMARSLAAGRRLANPKGAASICDAILTPTPGELTFPVLARLAGPGLVVPDSACLNAMARAFADLKLVLEPGGAAALAAALTCRDEVEGDVVIVVATGGNCDAHVFSGALGLAAAPS